MPVLWLVYLPHRRREEEEGGEQVKLKRMRTWRGYALILRENGKTDHFLDGAPVLTTEPEDFPEKGQRIAYVEVREVPRKPRGRKK